VVPEDQGELAKRFPGSFTGFGPVRPPDSPFFSAQAAMDIRGRLEHAFPIEAAPVSSAQFVFAILAINACICFSNTGERVVWFYEGIYLAKLMRSAGSGTGAPNASC
jgi:hypothetical protein